MTTGKPSRRRTVSVVVLGILACIAITLSATTVWVHQVALNTDRYVSVVSRVATNPEVVEEVSGRLADQVVEQFDVPRLVKPLIRNWIQEQLATFMGTDLFLDAWAAANRAAHTALLAILRSDRVLHDEKVTISALPVILVALQRLQDVGVLPDDLDLPDPSDEEAVDAIREVLTDRLGIELAPDFGEITLVRAARLDALRQWVKVFDLITIASVFLALGLVALTVYLSRDRLRAAIFLGLGAVVAVLLAQATTVAVGGAVTDALAEDGSRGTLTALVNAMLGNLATALTVVLGLGAAVAVVAYILRRRSLASLEPVAVGALPDAAPAAEPVVATPEPAPASPPAKKAAARAASTTQATPAKKTAVKPAAKPAAKKGTTKATSTRKAPSKASPPESPPVEPPAGEAET